MAGVIDISRLPDDYLVIDLETSGITNDDKIIQLGWARVQNREVVTQFAVYLNYDVPIHPKAYAVHGIESSTLQELGADPESTISLLHGFMRAAVRENTWIAGWNYPGLDARMMRNAFKEFGLDEFDFDASPCVDPGLMYKASVMNRVRKPWESTWEFFNDIAHSPRKGLYWNMDKVSGELGLDTEKVASMRSSHDAMDDCLITAATIEAMRGTKYERTLTGGHGE